MLLSSLISLDDESKCILRSLPAGGTLHVQLTKARAQHWSWKGRWWREAIPFSFRNDSVAKWGVFMNYISFLLGFHGHWGGGVGWPSAIFAVLCQCCLKFCMDAQNNFKPHQKKSSWWNIFRKTCIEQTSCVSLVQGISDPQTYIYSLQIS